MSKLIGDYLEKDTSHISPQNTPSSLAGRPYDTHLLDTQYTRSAFPHTDIVDGIARCFKKLKHPPLDIQSVPRESIFYLIDLDGTILDTEKLHFDSYTKAFQQHGYTFCSWETYQTLSSIEDYCRNYLGDTYDTVKETKNTVLYKTASISFLRGADTFLEWLVTSKQNFVIVTNTSKRTVEFYKEKIPLLQQVSQWITRDDVLSAKPNPEPYSLAKSKYWKNESYILGIENTICGYEALKDITSCIYIISEYKSIVYNALSNKDIYIVKDISDIYTSVAK
jgi:beta-phosphoglucomutase-like phosphatase (HAD superfamily)